VYLQIQIQPPLLQQQFPEHLLLVQPMLLDQLQQLWHTQRQQAMVVQRLRFTRQLQPPAVLQEHLLPLVLEQLQFPVCQLPQVTRLLLKQQILLVRARQAPQVIQLPRLLLLVLRLMAPALTHGLPQQA
jgi:hypothetical protein